MWTDQGMGQYDLHFLRDKDKNEVDFLVSKNRKPWMIIEVKTSMEEKLCSKPEKYAAQIKPEYIFQTAIEGNYIDKDVFHTNKPMIIPAKSFLSQLP